MSIEAIHKDYIDPEIAKIGMKRRVSGMYTLELAPGVLGWLGLNQATGHHAAGEFHINPVIGIRHQEIEKIAAECCSLKFHAYVPATINRPLGYLMPEDKYRTWEFNPAHAGENARAMAEAIAAHGLAFMRANKTLPDIIDKMEKRFNAMDEALAIRKPIAYFLLGDSPKARKTLDAELERIVSRKDLAAEYFRRFADVFGKKLAPQ